MLFPEIDRTSIQNRILEKSIPEPNTGCWLWLASLKNKAGYGQIMLRNKRGKPQYAHRVSFEAFKCEIPEDALVLHSCDQPCCVNPDHLRAGSISDNSKDMIKRNRGKGQLHRGDGRVKTTLSDAEVAEIFSDERRTKEISDSYKVSERHVRHIKLGQRRTIEKVARIIKR
jgi:hypothetical protein